MLSEVQKSAIEFSHGLNFILFVNLPMVMALVGSCTSLILNVRLLLTLANDDKAANL